MSLNYLLVYFLSHYNDAKVGFKLKNCLDIMMFELNREFLVKKFGSEERLHELTHIDVRGRKITNIESKTFQGLSKLERLYLHNNEITHLDGNAFHGLSNLKDLILSNNKLKRIDSNSLNGLTRLELLWLNDNFIEEIDASAFDDLVNLKELMLYNNRLKSLNSDRFKGVGKLERLSLYQNEITEFEANGLSNLKLLLISNNKLNTLALTGLTKLVKLALSNSGIAEIDRNAFESLSNLKVLKLNNNKLMRIESNAFKGLEKLEKISLNSNEIEAIDPMAFESLSNLYGLRLNDNRLREIDRKCFEPLKSIKELHLYDNELNALSFLISPEIDFLLYEKSKIDQNGFLSDWKGFLEQFPESIKQFHTPKLLIVDYYDALIRDVDIYTEELFEKYAENDMLPNTVKSEIIDESEYQCHKIEYKSNELMINVTPGEIKIREYLNLVRAKAIEEINNVKEENLQRYEMDKEKYKYNRDDLTDANVEEMRKHLFRDRFCFQLRIDSIFKEENKNLFKMFTIITDFYLDHYNRQEIKCLIGNYLVSPNVDNFVAHLMSNYINGLCKTYGNEVISIRKETLQRIEHIKMLSSEYCGKIDCDFRCEFVDISQLKSIDIRYHKFKSANKVENLFCLRNLEYLSISNGIFNRDTFTGLDNLIELKLDSCCVFDDSPDSNPFSSLSSLQILELKNSQYGLYKDKFNPSWLNRLNNLKKLRLRMRDYIRDVDFLQSESWSQLEYLSLNGCRIKEIKEEAFTKLKNLRYLDIGRNCFNFDMNLRLDRLETLIVKQSLLSHKKVAIKKGAFNGLRSLKLLDMSSNNIECIDPEVFIDTPMLAHLKLAGINCKLDMNTFRHLKHLKIVELSKSDRIESSVLDALKRSNIEIIINQF